MERAMRDSEIVISRDLLKLWLQFGEATPLEPSVRRYMQARTGADLGEVRIHTGPVAAQLCQTLKARALTLGDDILFAEGEYEPASVEGRWLLAHELVHVLQQRAGRGCAPGRRARSGFVALGDEHDACECEADLLAAEVLDGGLRSAVTPDYSGAIRGARRVTQDAAA
jgi:hypothetical protein